jgi:hypothetical protein
MASGRWAKGYTQTELDEAQQKFGLVFPPDLVALLRDRRPADGHVWTDEAAIRRIMEWGERPASSGARKEVLHSVVSRAPKLIPLIGHRYLPEEPRESGNPVFSVYQSDVIYYGENLADYFEPECNGGGYLPRLDQLKHIRSWSDLVERV